MRLTRKDFRKCKLCGSEDLFSQGLICKSCRRKKNLEYRNKHIEKERERTKIWQKENPDKMKASQKKWREDNRDKKRSADRISKLKRVYGITEQDVQTMYEKQKGLCAISGAPLDQTMHIDHDHISRKFRGLIQRKLNWALGLFDDDPKLLRAAADYLEENR